MTERLMPMTIGNQTVWVDVGDAPVVAGDADPYALVRTGAAASRIEGAIDAPTRELARADLMPTLQAVLEPIKAGLSDGIGIQEVTVELTLGIKGEVGFFIAKGEANGSIKVTAKWAPDKAGASGAAAAGKTT